MDADAPPSPPRRLLHILLVLFLSLLLPVLGYALEFAVRTTDHWDGFLTGGMHAIFLGPAWAIYILPLNVIVWGVYRLAKWRRFRTAWLLAPSVAVVSVFMVARLIVYPPTPEARFRYTTGQEFPIGEVSGLVCSFSGGGITDYDDHYVFSCAPEATERLIRDLRMSEGGDMDFGSFRDLPGGLTAAEFADAAYFKAMIREGWTCYLKTDATRSRVYIVVWCI